MRWSKVQCHVTNDDDATCRIVASHADCDRGFLRLRRRPVARGYSGTPDRVRDEGVTGTPITVVRILAKHVHPRDGSNLRWRCDCAAAALHRHVLKSMSYFECYGGKLLLFGPRPGCRDRRQPGTVMSLRQRGTWHRSPRRPVPGTCLRRHLTCPPTDARGGSCSADADHWCW